MDFGKFWGGAAAPYEIEQSLRFDGSSYMTRTPSSAGNRTTWTLSFWHKRSELGTGTLAGYQTVLAAKSGSGDDTVRFDTSNRFKWFLNDTSDGNLDTSALHRDTSAWAHYVVVADYSNSTANDRNRMYINGVQVTDFSSRTNAPLNFSGGINNTVDQVVGRRWTGSTYYLKGYLAEVHLIDGTAVTDALDFGEYDDNGVWRPIEYTGGSYGTNGFYLKFDSSATNGIGHDHSGNGNNFTASGFTTSGTGTDVMSDTPTNNFCTWNPLDSTGVTLNNGNLDFGYAGANDCGGTFALTSGKWYWEIECRTNIGTGGQPLAHGIHNASVTSDFRKQAIWFYTDEISAGVVRRYANNSVAASVSIPSALRTIDIGDYLQVAYDADSGEVWFAVNNTWMDGSGGTSGNPGSGSNPVFTLPDTSIPMTPWRSHAGLGWEGFTNFGQRDFQYTPPTGFKALSTSNLPAPTVKKGNKYFDTVLWTGDGNNRTISGFNFSPDFVWTKSRSNAYSHKLYDAIRGAGKILGSNSTYAETTDTNTLSGFTSSGFSLGTDTGINGSGVTFVGWAWDANGAGSSNTAGSITSTVSANPSAGFSIVSYTGNQASTQTVGHGLGIVPSFIIVKDRDSSSRNWVCYHKDLGLNKVILLNSANAPQTISGYWGTSITSTTFGLPAGGYDNNPTGDKLIAYCFAEVEGYSKFGSYTGNGSTDGVFLYCGFRPAWIMYKITNTTGNWLIHDTTRSEYNVTTNRLYANLTNAEGTSTTVSWDLLSNGAKIRTSDAGVNGSGNTFIFMAFAENPFGGEGVSPATAR